jgi:hypothetical protein
MLQSYYHLQVEIYTSEINITGLSRSAPAAMYNIYFRLKAVDRPKHVAANLNKIINNYWNRVALVGNLWTWSITRNRMQTLNFTFV